MAVCKNTPCSAQFVQINPGHLFHSAKCKAAWHREQLYKVSVAVTVVQARIMKKGINATVRIEHKDREQLAKIAIPGAKLFLVEAQEDVS